jgi:hypothetical protein
MRNTSFRDALRDSGARMRAALNSKIIYCDQQIL